MTPDELCDLVDARPRPFPARGIALARCGAPTQSRSPFVASWGRWAMDTHCDAGNG